MSSVDAAKYEIQILSDQTTFTNNDLFEILSRIVDRIEKLEELKVEKTTEKDGRKVTGIINIKPMIRELSVISSRDNQFFNGVVIEATVDAGSRSNLRPDLLYTAIKSLADFSITDANLHRKGLYAMKNGKLTGLWE
jgi:hypothetical protein